MERKAWNAEHVTVSRVSGDWQIQDFEKRRIRGFGVWLGLLEQFTKLLVHSRKPTVNKFIVVITVLGRIAVLCTCGLYVVTDRLSVCLSVTLVSPAKWLKRSRCRSG